MTIKFWWPFVTALLTTESARLRGQEKPAEALPPKQLS